MCQIYDKIWYDKSMNICLFCSSNELPEKYTHPATRLADQLAAGGHQLVYGGSSHGLMGRMARVMQAGGARVTGVTLSVYSASIHRGVDELIMAKTLGERKAAMLERSDVILVLVGGIGTLDELTELIELKRQWHHDKQIIVLNTDGFYDGFRMQLERIANENMLRAGENTHLAIRSLDEFVTFVESPNEAILLLGNVTTMAPR
ncbi:TIGR00730 family Rossman fold protein [Candidatus Mycosynbacter amalyticus]|uniref:Cytokinin riboside 5'-monophosphate phosphoribohydrolase n=2 Tax=Candidatus Mycosynbacter amalyticus TaxID=2665156 RepID=A0A857MPW8_9BACT|nr:TIGR00730 family Rossman fold protein [Candidatus Mycosynbacter amalyticus]